jgi:hypothetical protein
MNQSTLIGAAALLMLVIWGGDLMEGIFPSPSEPAAPEPAAQAELHPWITELHQYYAAAVVHRLREKHTIDSYAMNVHETSERATFELTLLTSVGEARPLAEAGCSVLTQVFTGWDAVRAENMASGEAHTCKVGRHDPMKPRLL